MRRANEIRSTRARIKQQLASGELVLADLMRDPPSEIDTAKLGEVLQWLPGVGRERARKILAPGPGSPGVGRDVRIGDTSETTRRLVVARFERHAPPVYSRAA